MDAHEDVSGRSRQIEDHRSSRSRPRQNSIQVPAQVQVPARGKFPNRPPAKISTPTSHEVSRDILFFILSLSAWSMVDHGRRLPLPLGTMRELNTSDVKRINRWFSQSLERRGAFPNLLSTIANILNV